MTSLERRCRLLLCVYPAVYRKGRGEEIIGTLLDATPAGRSWPRARDIRSLVVGGRRTRATLNRRQTTAANLRIAVMVGAAAYLAFVAAADISFAVLNLTTKTGQGYQGARPTLVVGAVVGLTVALVWVSRRRAVLMAAMLAATVVVSLTGYWRSVVGWPLSQLACLAVLALLAGRKLPSRRWLWPVGLVVAFPLVGYLGPGIWPLSILGLLGVMGVISLLWVVIDARPAVAMAVFLLALLLPAGIVSVAGADIAAGVPVLIALVVTVFAVWRLHRQSARVTPGRES